MAKEATNLLTEEEGEKAEKVIAETSGELVDDWFQKYVVEDQEECIIIGESSREQCLEFWNCDIGDGKTALAIYSVIYDQILKALKEQRANRSQFALTIADIVEIGYDDDTKDAETEKLGNLSPFIVHLGGHVKYQPAIDKETVARFTEWTSANITTNRNLLDQIATASISGLDKIFNIELAVSAGVWPIFCTIHDQLCGFLKVKLEEHQMNDVSINFAANFDAYCRRYEDGGTGVEFSPKPSQKLFTKGDGVATAVHES